MLCRELLKLNHIVPRICPILYMNPDVCLKTARKFSTSPTNLDGSSKPDIPDGLVEFAKFRLNSGDGEKRDNFSVKQSLQTAVEELETSLADREELLLILRDEESDQEIIKMAAKDIEQIDSTCVSLVSQIKNLVSAPQIYDSEDAVIEVVPGVGGLEANMFAEEIFNMYLKYVDELGFSLGATEVARSNVGINSKFSSTTGITQASAEISGVNVFGQLKFESGVHRVQRVPVTGTKSDRMQTSTCSVAILPKPKEVDIDIPDKDMKIEFMRSSGAGGQSVNTTDSACRILHLPTGLAVKCQMERNQAQNKKIALEMLKQQLYQAEFNEMMGKLASSRKLQIGSMNRNEKIRTYHFGRHTLSEHRLKVNKNVSNMVAFLSGDYGFEILQEFHRSLADLDREESFQESLREFQTRS